MDASNQELSVHSEKGRFNRRRLITRVLPGAGVLLVGCGLEKKGEDKPESIETPPKIITPSPTETAVNTKGPDNTVLPTKEDFAMLRTDYITVYIGNDGIPVKYVRNDAPDKAIPIDREKALAVQSQARSKGEIELLEFVYYEDGEKDADKQDEEHFASPDLPKDIVEERDLKAKGINIIQADNTSLFVRQAALAKDGPLAPFNNTGRKINLVLVDGPAIHPRYMKGAKYDGVRRIVEEEIAKEVLPTPEEYRIQTIADCEAEIKSLDRKTQSSRIVSLKAQIAELKLATEEELKDEVIITSMLPIGLYSSQNTFDQTKPATVFVATGKGLENKSKTTIGFDQNGNVIAHTFFSEYLRDNRPKPSRGQLSPKDLTQRPPSNNPNSYLYSTDSPGFTLLHELGHADEDISLGLGNIIGVRPTERYADTYAAKKIISGSDKWTKLGDNSGYYFAFSVPKELGGGYIVTKNIQQDLSKQEVKIF